MAKADLGGRLFVWGVEIAGEANKNKRSLADPPSPQSSFLNSTFTDALEAAQNRGLIDDEGVADLVSMYRTRGAEAAEAALRRLQSRIANLIEAILRAGGTLAEFGQQVQEGRAELGFEKASPAYLENVFRSSVQASYSAGRHKGLTDAVSAGAIDFVSRRAIGDGRTRATHQALDGKVWLASDPEWKRFAPPLLDGVFEYQCRCTHVATFEGDFPRSALQSPASDIVRATDPNFDRGNAPRFADPEEMMRAQIR